MIINSFIFGVTFDPDAQAFITAAGITDNTQKNAINTLVLDLKGFNIWTKMKAIYPMVGGTATTHKFNLKNPLDTNTAFRLIFGGGWTHSSTGAKPNGLNGYAETYLVQSSEFANDNNIHLSYYSRTNISSNSVEIGCYDNTRACQILIRNSGVAPISTRTFQNNLTDVKYTETTSLGLFIGNRIGTNVKIFKNSVEQISVTNSANGRTTISFWIGAQNYFGLNIPSPKECAFSTIGEGLTDIEVANFYVTVQNFNTTLSRQVI
jgi:hypothetical protein